MEFSIFIYMKVHVYSTLVVKWNKKRKEKKRKTIHTNPPFSTYHPIQTNIQRGHLDAQP